MTPYELRRLIQTHADLATPEDEILKVVDDVVETLESRKVIIYGAGALGGILSGLLTELSIPVHCYVDRAADKIRKIGSIPVNTPDYLASLNPNNDFVVIVAINTKNLAHNIMGKICELGNDIWAIDGWELSRILRYPHCLKIHKSYENFNIVDCVRCGFEERGCPFCYSYIRRIAQFQPFKSEVSHRFDWLGYIMGQICTLKCKYCCEGVPYIKKASFVPADIIVSDLTKIADSCAFLKYVELIGGEPLLHPEFEKVLKQLLEIENIGYIKIFTNGTVVPSESILNLLENCRIMLHVSNYIDQLNGQLLENSTKFMSMVNAHNIDYVFLQNSNWLNFTGCNQRRISDNDLEQAFSNCFLSNCHRLHRGILYRCPHQYAGIQLGELTNKAGEIIKIHELDQAGLAKALDDFESLKFTDACRHCNMPYDAPEIPVGEQIQ